MKKGETVTLDEVIGALKELGGEADSSEIRKKVEAMHNNILPEGYSYWTSYRNSIDQILHFYCPQCAKFLGGRVIFEQVSRGRYRLLGG